MKYVSDWENPLITGRNKLPPHADRHFPEKITLNGVWRFGSFLSEDLDSFPDLELPHTLEVPFHPELAGFNIPIYTNIQYPFTPQPPLVPRENNPLSVYRREFELPENWQRKRVFLSFQGADSFLSVAVNGVKIGCSKGSRNPAEFEITSFLTPGKNRIDAATLRWSDGTYLEDQDMWWLSGLFREVFLYAAEDPFIEDFEIQNTLDSFSLKVKTSAPCRVSVELEGVFSCEIDSDEELFRKVAVQPWSAETPRLYTLRLKTACDELETKTGFRTVEIRSGELLINRKSVKLFGVNYHEFNCRRGRAVTEEDMLWDIRTMKENNFNAVRNSHYPHCSRWYELCDQYGLYVFDEADLETHGMQSVLSEDPQWQEAYLDREIRMVERNKNHPSIIVWSLGNESGTGVNMEACSRYIRQRDPSRPVNYYHAGTRDYVDIVGLHYPSLEKIREALQEEKSCRPVLLEEFAHSMGNGTGNMAEYTALWESEKRLIGGFIWDWIDQGLAKKGPDGKIFFAYGGDFGDTPNDYQFCHNGLVSPDRRIKGALSDLRYVFRPFLFSLCGGRLSVRNRLSFRDLASFKTMVNGKELSCSCPPGETRVIAKNVPEYLEIRVIDQNGKSVEEEQHGIPPRPLIPSCGKRAARRNSQYGNAEFCQQQGLCRWNNVDLEGISLEIFRAPTNNDKPFLEMWHAPGISGAWKSRITDLCFEEKSLTVIQESPFFTARQTYEFYENGFDLTTEFSPGEKLPECLPKIGLCLKLPQKFDSLLWFGRGPQECYRDRCSGAKISSYSARVDDLWNSYVMPQENGNHCDVYCSGVFDCEGNGFGCVSEIPFETSLRRWSAGEINAARHEYELPHSEAVYWSLDLLNAGVGNGSHGPGTLKKYQVPPERKSWKWRFFSFSNDFSKQFKNNNPQER